MTLIQGGGFARAKNVVFVKFVTIAMRGLVPLYYADIDWDTRVTVSALPTFQHAIPWRGCEKYW